MGNFQNIVDRKDDVENLIKSTLMKSEKEIDWDIMNLIPDFFAGKDALSTIARTFKKETNIPIALPIFSLISFISSYLIDKEVRVRVPMLADPLEPKLWLIGLAPSGSAKTFSKSIIEKSISASFKPKMFEEAAGPAAFVEELKEKNRGLYFQDECAQVLKQIEMAGSPMAELKKYLLNAFDEKTITRKTKKDSITIENPVFSVFWLNTIDSFVKAISEESMKDGFSRRFLYVIATRELEKEAEDFPMFNTKIIKDEIKKPIDELFNTELYDYYDITKEAYEVYDSAFKYTRKAHFNQSINENVYRTAMMSSYIYAVIYHIVLGKKNNMIDEQDMGLALKAVLFHLYSYKNLLKYKANGFEEEVDKRERILQKVISVKSECNEVFNARYVMRRVKAIKTAKEADEYIELAKNRK